MMKNKLITPEGTRDILFEDCNARRKAENNIKSVFAARGYSEVITPGIEFYDVFNSQNHGISQEDMYKLTDLKGRILTIRPDLTMPIARLSATRLKGYTLPLRLYYNQSVYIVNPALSGRSDEVAQIGIELIGSKNKRTDLEVIVTALEALQSCGLKDFRLEIGHIGFFNTLIAQLHISDSEKDEIRMLIETKNYPSLNDQLDQLENKEVANALKQLPALFGGEEVFEKAAALYDSETLRETTRYLKSIYTALSKSGLDDKISLDLGIVTRNDYYTGIVFKGYVRGLGTKVLVGGRYDSLLSDYGVDLPAIGFGINVDAVAGAIKNDDDAPPVADVLLFAEEGYEVETLLRMNELTKSGLVAEFSVFESFEKTKKYAIQKGIPKIYVIREETLEVSL